jgi:hypothetical protein
MHKLKAELNKLIFESIGFVPNKIFQSSLGINVEELKSNESIVVETESEREEFPIYYGAYQDVEIASSYISKSELGMLIFSEGNFEFALIANFEVDDAGVFLEKFNDKWVEVNIIPHMTLASSLYAMVESGAMFTKPTSKKVVEKYSSLVQSVLG